MIVKTGGVDLFYNISGTGPPLLLLHGNGEDHQIFDKLAEKLMKNFTIYAVDSVNHGQSSKTNIFNYESMAKDFFSFIDTLKLKNVNILGFSDGGITALLMGLEQRSEISKLIILGVNLKPADFTPENYAYIVKEYEKNADPLFKMMLEEPNIELADLAKITCPVLVIAAENDLYLEELPFEIAKTIPNAAVQIMKNHDHGSYIIDSDLLAPEIIKFLK